MRNTLFIIFLACITFSCATENKGTDKKAPTIIWDFLVSKPVLLGYGIIAGIAGGYVLGFRKKVLHKPANHNRHQQADSELENKYFDLETRFKKTEHENQQLKRQLAEAEQFSIKADEQKRDTIQTETEKIFDQALKPKPQMQETTTEYYLQPGANSRFKEISKVNNITEALYILTYQNDNPTEAELKFIDTPDNAFLAVQNEPTWILVACERNNVPTEHTTSIRTDIPGKAILKNGEWEILQKAKITYV
jgi:hypothetical protein